MRPVWGSRSRPYCAVHAVGMCPRPAGASNGSPFMNHRAMAPEVVSRHRRSASPSPSKSPTPAIAHGVATFPRPGVLAIASPFMSQMAVARRSLLPWPLKSIGDNGPREPQLGDVRSPSARVLDVLARHPDGRGAARSITALDRSPMRPLGSFRGPPRPAVQRTATRYSAGHGSVRVSWALASRGAEMASPPSAMTTSGNHDIVGLSRTQIGRPTQIARTVVRST